MPGRSKSLRWISTSASLAAAVALAGCQPEPPPITWQGEIIRFGTETPEDVCSGSLEWMDDRAMALKQVFGADTYDAIDFYWVPTSWDGWPCLYASGGCTSANVVHSEHVPHEHELVHAIRRDRLPAVFEEGLAEVFGDVGWTREPASRERLLEVLESGGPPTNTAEYARAGHFVAFLLETHGIEALDRLAALSDVDDDYSNIRASFADAYGFSLDQALAEYQDFPECDALAWKDTRIACAHPGQPASPMVSGGAEFSMVMDCSGPDVLGPFAGFMYTETVLEISPEVGLPVWVSLVGDLDPDVSAALLSCGGCGESTTLWLTSAKPLEQLDLPAGRYVLRMFRPVDEPGELGISLRF